MGNIFNDDFMDFIKALNKAQVEYILVGGYSVILHGYHRSTGDLDIWVNTTEDNYQKLVHAFKLFGMPMFNITLDFFLEKENEVFKFGRVPNRIDLMTQVKGLIFKEAFLNSNLVDVDGLEIRLVFLNDLLKAKRAANRHKDLNDIEHLTEDE